MSDEPLHVLLETLPTSSMTTRLLGALDWIVPGEWQNVTSLEAMIKDVTGETDEALLQQVGERAIHLYADPAQGYQRAVWVFRAVDDTGAIAGAASLANKLGERFEWLSFLESVTPKPDTVQAVDAGVKLVAELAAFCLTNGLPGDSVGDFVRSLGAYSKEESMRLAAFLAFDCVLPFGPDFLAKLVSSVHDLSGDALASHGRFARVAQWLPGGIDEKRQLVAGTLEQAGSTLTKWVDATGVTQASVYDRVKEHLDTAGSAFDYLAAAIDLSTSVYEHTGIQTVARRVVSRAYGEI